MGVKRIKGLDSIRFICAIFVLFGHAGVPVLDYLINSHHKYIQSLGKLLGLIFNGPAAVIVFFIISGFCIHYPLREKTSIHLPSYYVRRLLRIGLPALAGVIVYLLLNVALVPPQFGIFWSIICEVIYYIIYPVIFYANKRFKVSWVAFVASAYLIAFALMFFNQKDLLTNNMAYPALGLNTWLIGLPCWLLGCWLAENYTKFATLSFVKMWGLRILVILVVLGLRIIKFHVSGVIASNCVTLNIFALGACCWIGFEIAYYEVYKPLNVLEWAGKWSYSLYIMHPPTFTLVWLIGLGSLHSKAIVVVMCLIVAYLFYLIIEKPTHKLAALAGAFFQSKPKPA